MSGAPIMTVAAVEEFLAREFPQIDGLYAIEAVGPLSARLRCIFNEAQLRPGGTISGPTIMALADVSLYVTILANRGPIALAVTSSLSFNFLRKPERRPLIAECRLLKLGRTLAVGEVSIRSEGGVEPVAHAVGTYSLPSQS